MMPVPGIWKSGRGGPVLIRGSAVTSTAVIGSNVDQFSSIASPQRTFTAVFGHLVDGALSRVCARRGEPSQIHLVASRLVGLISDPATIGRKLAKRFGERGAYQGDGRAVAIHG
jgi:hypothetical protein